MKQVEERYISLLTDFGFDRLFEEAEIAKFTPQEMREYETLSLIHISEPTRPGTVSRMPSSA